MLKVTEESNLVRIRAGGTLVSSDYDQFVAIFEKIGARQVGSVPMVIELAPDFSGWDLGGLRRELKFDLKHQDQFGRIAIVVTEEWEKWGTDLSDPLFPSAELRFFYPTNIAEAEAWVRSESGGKIS